MTRPLFEIAAEIILDWPSPYFGAAPYLEAMTCLDSIDDCYGLDSGRSIVLYFLSNAHTWRGATARKVKAELNNLVKLSQRREKQSKVR